jgi:serine phosphatase RsbU (regulator of sigma subunit)
MAERFLSVRQLMQAEPVVVPPVCPIRHVLASMNQFRIGAVVVVAPDQSLVGIFTERDLLRRVAEADPGWRDLPVSEWMTPNPHTVNPDLGWEEVTALIERLRVRHLPVIDNGRVIGIISTRMLMGRRQEYLNRQIEEQTRELRLANDELMARDADLRYSLRAASRFQTRLLLPSAPPNDWPELRWGVHFAPLDHLGGDYYDIARPDPNHLGFLIADASGHSIAAMMVAIISRAAFAEVAGTTLSPGAVLTAMNERLQGLADERFVTAFYGVLDRRDWTLTYANAGHPYPLLRKATGEVVSLSAQGFMLGIMPGEQYREKSVQLSPGDKLCFYTDGVIEARNEIGDTFGTERLMGCLTTHGKEPSAQLSASILTCQTAFRGTNPLSDDVTLVMAELTGSS